VQTYEIEGEETTTVAKGKVNGDQDNYIAEAKGALYNLVHTAPADTLHLYIDNLSVVQTWKKDTRDDTAARMTMPGRAVWNQIQDMTAWRKNNGGETHVHWIHSHVDKKERQQRKATAPDCACGARKCDPDHYHHQGNAKADEVADEGLTCVSDHAWDASDFGEEAWTMKIHGKHIQGDIRTAIRDAIIADRVQRMSTPTQSQQPPSGRAQTWAQRYWESHKAHRQTWGRTTVVPHSFKIRSLTDTLPLHKNEYEKWRESPDNSYYAKYGHKLEGGTCKLCGRRCIEDMEHMLGECELHAEVREATLQQIETKWRKKGMSREWQDLNWVEGERNKTSAMGWTRWLGLVPQHIDDQMSAWSECEQKKASGLVADTVRTLAKMSHTVWKTRCQQVTEWEKREGVKKALPHVTRTTHNKRGRPKKLPEELSEAYARRQRRIETQQREPAWKAKIIAAKENAERAKDKMRKEAGMEADMEKYATEEATLVKRREMDRIHTTVAARKVKKKKIRVTVKMRENGEMSEFASETKTARSGSTEKRKECEGDGKAQGEDMTNAQVRTKRRHVSKPYEVDEVRGYYCKDGVDMYLIKWRGYKEEDNSWEPRENLQCTKRLASYHRERRGGTKRARERNAYLQRIESITEGQLVWWGEHGKSGRVAEVKLTAQGIGLLIEDGGEVVEAWRVGEVTGVGEEGPVHSGVQRRSETRALLDDLTMIELKQIMDENGVHYTGKRRKAEYIDAIVHWDEGRSEMGLSTQSEEREGEAKPYQEDSAEATDRGDSQTREGQSHESELHTEKLVVIATALFHIPGMSTTYAEVVTQLREHIAALDTYEAYLGCELRMHIMCCPVAYGDLQEQQRTDPAKMWRRVTVSNWQEGVPKWYPLDFMNKQLQSHNKTMACLTRYLVPEAPPRVGTHYIFSDANDMVTPAGIETMALHGPVSVCVDTTLLNKSSIKNNQCYYLGGAVGMEGLMLQTFQREIRVAVTNMMSAVGVTNHIRTANARAAKWLESEGFNVERSLDFMDQALMQVALGRLPIGVSEIQVRYAPPKNGCPEQWIGEQGTALLSGAWKVATSRGEASAT